MNLPEFRDIASASKQVATYSAMNPILWKTVICSPIAIICSVLAPSLPILIGCWGFVHFARKDPGRLQSEGLIEQMEVLSRIGDNATKSQITIEGNAIPTANSAVAGLKS